ncbi:anti-sigma factor [Bacteroidia bacterium]|nr:anti-sigma factor [Bacteroidia bacterium]GHV22106.1 anti-sigma factor [Bacteroidia bacterium]
MTIIKRILVAFFENDYPQDIQRKFWRWFIDTAHTEEKEKALKSVWDSMRSEVTSATVKSLQEVESKLDFNRESTRSRSIILQLAKIAAILLIPVLSGLFTYVYLQKNEIPPKLVECYAADGELKRIYLPDSSVVTINSGSVIIYPEEQKGKQRYVYLNGEAYFEVVRNPDMPFVVKTDGVEVEVLGTKFNVSAYPDDPNITTTLETGKVRLNFEGEGVEDVILAPNDKVIYNKITEQLINMKVPNKYIADWREGHLSFTNANIHDVLRSFGHKYGISVYLNSDKYENAMLTIKFIHGETLEESLLVLKKIIPGFRYELAKNNLYIY